MRAAVLAAAFLLSGAVGAMAHDWTADELSVLRSLWIGSLEALPPDPSNRYADDPRAADMGHRLFFDTRLSANGAVACATCHRPEKYFTDGRTLSKGVGTAPRHAPTLVGTAHSPWFFWDGRKDSQWSQALGPLEAAVEHGGTRTQYVKYILSDPRYRAAYEALFGPSDVDPASLPDSAMPPDANWAGMDDAAREAVTRVFVNIGKAIAAYERRLMPGASRFDRYVAALIEGKRGRRILSADEVAGLRLFIGRGNCTQCHNGPLFTNNAFHNTGMPGAGGGRASGIRAALDDPFNCVGRFSDAGTTDCGELRFAKTTGPELPGAFKSPTLRNVAETAPYMHDGSLPTLRAVLEHYNAAPAATVGKSELRPLGLTTRELDRLEAFLRTLSGPPETPEALLRAPR